MSGGILLQPAVGGSSAAPSGAAGGDLTGTYPNPTVANGKITDAKIAAGGLTDAAIAAAAGIAQSKVATLVVDLAAKAPSANPTFTGTVTVPTPAAGDNTTKAASTAFVRAAAARPCPVRSANSGIVNVNSAQAVMTTALKPTFYYIDPEGCPFLSLVQLGTQINTGEAASTIGIAIYTITYSAASTFSASLVCQLNASLSGASGVTVRGDVTTGAAGSGASIPVLDFTQNDYICGLMVSSITTLAMRSSSFNGTAFTNLGFFPWGAAARSSVTDWPASFDQTSVTFATARYGLVNLYTAQGKLSF